MESIFPVLDACPCAKCQRITLDAMLSQEGYRHHENRLDLLAAARGGCWICLWIYAFWDCRVLSFPSNDEIRPKECWMSFLASKFLSLFTDEGALLQILLLVLADLSEIQALRVAKRSTAEATIKRFKPTLKQSEVNETAPALPRRVLDVGNDNTDVVYLMDFGNTLPKAHYICLSHRWSHSSPLTTIKETVTSRHIGISIQDLSATLRDAIHGSCFRGLFFLF